MAACALPELETNGGFPALAPHIPGLMVAAVHAACGSVTAIRLPAVLPTRAVRRVRCSQCKQSYEAEKIVELGLDAAAQPVADGHPFAPPGASRRLARMPAGIANLNRARAIRLAGVAVAAAAVLAVLLLIRGPEQAIQTEASGTSNADASVAPVRPGKAIRKAGKDARMVQGAVFSLALPSGWKQVKDSAGAGFAAVSADGQADARLWIEKDAGLDMAEFEARSLEQLEQLAGSARVVERVDAPTPEASSIRLAADAPADAPSYEVVLRSAGPYRYYLATTEQPGARASAAEDIALIQSSFLPTPGDGGG